MQVLLAMNHLALIKIRRQNGIYDDAMNACFCYEKTHYNIKFVTCNRRRDFIYTGRINSQHPVAIEIM
jgi:hypothetical protein